MKGLKSKLASQNKSSSALEDECEELKAEIEKEQELQNQLEEDVKATQAELEKQITATNDANKEVIYGTNVLTKLNIINKCVSLKSVYIYIRQT